MQSWVETTQHLFFSECTDILKPSKPLSNIWKCVADIWFSSKSPAFVSLCIHQSVRIMSESVCRLVARLRRWIKYLLNGSSCSPLYDFIIRGLLLTMGSAAQITHSVQQLFLLSTESQVKHPWRIKEHVNLSHLCLSHAISIILWFKTEKCERQSHLRAMSWTVHGVFLSHLSQVFTIKDMSFKAGMEMKVSGKTKPGCEACVHMLFNFMQ